jgi:uncharacterized protein (DUF433 family)
MNESVVVQDPEILSGTPVFAGTRVPVRNLLDYVEGGYGGDCNPSQTTHHYWGLPAS